MEIELKLVFDPQAARDIARSPLLRESQRSRPVTRTLHSIYFDTPDASLAAAGMALRIRRSGRRWIQTFKCGGGVDSGLHRREEYEAPAPAGILNLPALADTPVAAMLSKADFIDHLQPVFVTRFRRTTRDVEIHPGQMAEFAMDLGEVMAGERRAPINEVEIELRNGNVRHLVEFARRLALEVDLRLENVSKAQRGYQLLSRAEVMPLRAGTPALHPGMSATDALRTIVESCLTQLQGNEAGVLHSADPEYIHQARVAVRRLRSAFSLFRPLVPREHVIRVMDPLRKLGLSLGQARDWDVFASTTLPPVQEALGPDGSALDGLAARAASRREEAREHARAALSPRLYTPLLLDVALLCMHEAPWQADPQNPSAVPPLIGAIAPRPAPATVAPRAQGGPYRRSHGRCVPARPAHRDQEAAIRTGILRIAVSTQECQGAGSGLRRTAGDPGIPERRGGLRPPPRSLEFR
ncbi:MAG: CYTH and CHAD domain-containing protein [Betaproteobacteria bacterium]|nr:CYTH and CHAD domain-containing protein [Betaproteobacteria bacterium]